MKNPQPIPPSLRFFDRPRFSYHPTRCEAFSVTVPPPKKGFGFQIYPISWLMPTYLNHIVSIMHLTDHFLHFLCLPPSWILQQSHSLSGIQQAHLFFRIQRRLQILLYHWCFWEEQIQTSYWKYIWGLARSLSMYPPHFRSNLSPPVSLTQSLFHPLPDRFHTPSPRFLHRVPWEIRRGWF